MVDVKIEDLQAHFKDYRVSQTTAKGVGCFKEVIIRTYSPKKESIFSYADGNNQECNTEDIVETHYKQVLEEEAKQADAVKYIRILPEIKKHLDEDGEFTGHYSIRSRIQFGRLNECITMEQRDNLIELGWRVD